MTLKYGRVSKEQLLKDPALKKWDKPGLINDGILIYINNGLMDIIYIMSNFLI